MELDVAALLQWKSLAIGLWLAAFFLLERLVPAAPVPEARLRGGVWQRVFVNGGLWTLNIALSLIIVVPLSAWATGTALDWRPDWWSGLQGLFIDLLILDCLIYWWHRANHEIPLLWRFHEVHHLDRFLDSTSAVRFHWGEVLLSAGVRAAIIVALDFPISSILVFETVVLAAAIFQHSNVKLPSGLERALSFVLITPSIHWVHHHAVRRDTDSNYGNLLSVWDRIFGSLNPNPRDPEMEIGVERRDEESFASLLVHPFKSQG